jgi:hypothetical protein
MGALNSSGKILPARFGAARFGASRFGFHPGSIKPSATAPATSKPEYIWKNLVFPTGAWDEFIPVDPPPPDPDPGEDMCDQFFCIDDYGAIGDGADGNAETNSAAIALAIAAAGAGGVIFVPKGTYVIASEVVFTLAGQTLLGTSSGTATTAKGSTLRVKPGFTGPMFRTQVAAGDNGTMVRHLRFDATTGAGNVREPGVTCIIDIVQNEINKTYFDDVTMKGCTIGVRMTGTNYDSIYFNKMLCNDIDTGFDCSGTDGRLIVISNSRLTCKNRSILLGPDAGTGKWAFFKVENCQLNVSGAPSDVVMVRNAENVVFRDNWIEVDSGISTAPINAMIVLGTAGVSRPESVFIHGNRFQGNSVADYAVSVVNCSRPRVRDNYSLSLLARFIQSIDTGSFGQAQGNTTGGSGYVVTDATGWTFVQGNSTLADPQFPTPFRVRLPSTGAALGVQESADTDDRVAIRSDGLVRFGSGAAAFDVELSRKAANVLGLASGDVFRHQSGATGSRPNAASVGAGSEWFDTTLGIPIWSDGTDWVDATGAVV